MIECKGGFTVRIHRQLVLNNSKFLASELLHCKRQVASSIHVLRVDSLPRRFLKRYALWLYASDDFATFDPSLSAPEFFLELNDLYNTAATLQDEGFANDIMDAMIVHLVQRCDEMRLEDFLNEFLQSNKKGSMSRKLIADWMVSSMVVSDVKPKDLLRQVADTDFCYAVAKAVLRKKSPPYLVSPCFYHAHENSDRAGCRAKIEVMDKA